MPKITLKEYHVTINGAPVEREYEYVVEGNAVRVRGEVKQ